MANMFCFQCQETAKGTGCTVRGVCGKLPETNRWMDLLLSVVRGVGTIYHSLLEDGANDDVKVDDFKSTTASLSRSCCSQRLLSEASRSLHTTR